MVTHEVFVVDGKAVTEADLIAEFRPLAARIAADAAAVDADFDTHGTRFDMMSVRQYLDAASAAASPRARALVEATIRTEFGSEPDEVSALELFFNLPAIDTDRVALISGSDERYSLAGGSSTIPRALATPLMDRIRTGQALLAMRRKGKAVELRFANGSLVVADRVIVTVPAQVLRSIDFGDTLPAPWLALTRELSCGRNEKINAGYATRPWEAVTGAGGAAWAARTGGDPGLFSEFWGASAGQDTVPAGVLTWFFGGKQTSGLADFAPDALLRACEREIAPPSRASPRAVSAAPPGRWIRSRKAPIRASCLDSSPASRGISGSRKRTARSPRPALRPDPVRRRASVRCAHGLHERRGADRALAAEQLIGVRA